MDCTRDEAKLKKSLIVFFQSVGLNVHTTTKALGHQGFFKVNRIDISKNIKPERIIPTLLHEFAHYIIYCIAPQCTSLEPIFEEDNKLIKQELMLVTNFVDKNSNIEKLFVQKNNLKNLINTQEKIIKKKYNNFKRTDEFKPFKKYARFSNLKHLERYDAIKVLHWFKFKTYSILNLEQEFPDIPKEFIAYLKLKSCQRRQNKITRKINKLTKYYNEPTELFARFIESLYIDLEKTKQLAPYTFEIFKKKYHNFDYKYLHELFTIVNISL